MTKPDRTESMIRARRACLLLTGYATGEAYSLLLPPDPLTREVVADLLNQFCRLDAKERRAITAAKRGGSKPKATSAANGRLGGRPKKT